MLHVAIRIPVLEFISLYTPFDFQFLLLNRMVDGRVLKPDRPSCWHGLRHVLRPLRFDRPADYLRSKLHFWHGLRHVLPTTRC